MPKGIQVVVGELQLLERNELAAPVRTGSGRVWVHVEPSGHSGLCLSRHRPAEPRKDGSIRDQCAQDGLEHRPGSLPLLRACALRKGPVLLVDRGGLLYSGTCSPDKC